MSDATHKPDAPPDRRVRRLAAMKRTDHWLGLPLCFLLGLAATVARAILRRPRPSIAGNRPIAVFKFFGLGSIVEATPLLRAIRTRYPHAPLVFVSFSGNRELLELSGLCQHVYVIRTGGIGVFARDVLATVWRLRQIRVQAVVDLELFSKFSTLLAFASGAPVRVGYHLNDFWRYSLVTHPVNYNYFRHLSDVFCEAGEAIDAPVARRALEPFSLPPAARQAALALLDSHGWRRGQRLLGVNVNAAELSLERRWPLDRFAAVIERLLAADAQLRVVLTGSGDEQGYVEQILPFLSATARQRTIVGCGRLSLAEFLAAVELMDVLLTNDSGPLHLAAAQGAAIVSIWGPTRPAFYAPAVANHRAVFADYRCSPCVGLFTTFEGMWCGRAAWCMQMIEPPAVAEAVEAMLAQAPRTAASQEAP